MTMAVMMLRQHEMTIRRQIPQIVKTVLHVISVVQVIRGLGLAQATADVAKITNKHLTLNTNIQNQYLNKEHAQYILLFTVQTYTPVKMPATNIHPPEKLSVRGHTEQQFEVWKIQIQV